MGEANADNSNQAGSTDVGRGAAEGAVPVELVLDALACPAVLVEVGTGRVLVVNRAAANASLEMLAEGDGRLGYYAADPGGGRLVPEETPVLRAGRGEEFRSLRMAWHTPRGRMFYLVSSQVAEPGEGRRPVAVVTFLDVTHLEAAEAELRQVVRARDEFMSVATHELREPLNAMMLSLQLVEAIGAERATPECEAIRPQLEVMRRQGVRLGRLVENLLDVSRVSNDLLYLDPEALDLCALAREVVERFRRDDPVAAETVSLVTCEPVIGYFDRLRIDQVLSNLLINAMKYGAGKPVAVRVSADEETATLEVSDDGIGIDAADHGRVFERFERATSGHRRNSLGLGLYIVRAIVEAHGGRIRLRSEVGRGSTFTIELPRRRMHGREDGGS